VEKDESIWTSIINPEETKKVLLAVTLYSNNVKKIQKVGCWVKYGS
jgi:hypothetical protein